MKERTPLLTTREVADWLGNRLGTNALRFDISTETVLRRWRSGELPG